MEMKMKKSMGKKASRVSHLSFSGPMILFLLFNASAFVVSWTASAFMLPDSGQSKCYEAVSPYVVISCAGTGQDGEYDINPISYAYSGGGMVADFNTGLTWQKEDDNTYRTWEEANAYCSALSLGGNDDWRLPEKKELVSIVDFSIPWLGPTINWSYFPNTESEPYWTSTTIAGNPDYAWTAYFGHALVFEYDKNDFARVRCVRGDPAPAKSLSGDSETVSDNSTMLMWQKGEAGTRIWGNALTYCEGLSLAGFSDWRLPNARELESLTDDALYNPAIKSGFFPNAVASSYWSSTSDDNFKKEAYIVNFTKGEVSVTSKDSDVSVRCVRGGRGASGRVRVHAVTPDYFQAIQDAYESILSGSGTIQAWGTDFSENLELNRDIGAVIEGGYDTAFSGKSGMTTVIGTMTVRGGSVTVENMIVR